MFRAYDLLLMHHCAVAGLAILILTTLIALGTLAMLVFYDDAPPDD